MNFKDKKYYIAKVLEFLGMLGVCAMFVALLVLMVLFA